jgi:hypothetical protein
MELLQEAGFIRKSRAATLLGAEALGMDEQIGSIRPGKLADLVVTTCNPLENFKVLYGTGHFHLDQDNRPAQLGGCVRQDGILCDPASCWRTCAASSFRPARKRARDRTRNACPTCPTDAARRYEPC